MGAEIEIWAGAKTLIRVEKVVRVGIWLLLVRVFLANLSLPLEKKLQQKLW